MLEGPRLQALAKAERSTSGFSSGKLRPQSVFCSVKTDKTTLHLAQPNRGELWQGVWFLSWKSCWGMVKNLLACRILLGNFAVGS